MREIGRKGFAAFAAYRICDREWGCVYCKTGTSCVAHIIITQQDKSALNIIQMYYVI